MEVVSYLLGKKAGGGSNFQSKSVEITENGNTNIRPDTGYDALSNVTVNTNVSSGEVEEKDVNFYDYDGTRLYSYTTQEFLALEELPVNPTHEGLTAQGWNYDFADAYDYVDKYGELDIGQIYNTEDGSTQIHINLVGEIDKNLYLGLKVNGTVVIDWGDNTTNTITGTTIGTEINTPHTYSSLGKYIIKIKPNNNTTFKLSAGSSNSRIINNNDTSTIQVRHFLNLIEKIHIGNNITTIDDYTFNELNNLQELLFSNSITNIGRNGGFLFNNTRLKYLILPKNLEYIGAISQLQLCKRILIPKMNFTNTTYTSFSNMYSVEKIMIPEGTTNVRGIYNTNAKKIIIPDTVNSFYTASGNDMLLEIRLSENLTTIEGSVSRCPALRKIKIPKTLVSIPNSCFMNNFGISYFDFSEHTSIPTLGSNAFMNTTGKIIVPDDLYDEWITATNWSTYASQIVKASET